MNKLIIAFTIITMSSSAYAAPGQSKTTEATELGNIPLEILISKAKNIKDRNEKNKYAAAIRKQLPKTEQERQAVIKLLESGDADDKVIAMEVLARIKENRAVPAIIKNLKDKDNRVRVMAAGALGEIGDERAVDPLLENPDLVILEFGRCSVAKIGAPALPKLVSAAKKSHLMGLLPKKEGKDRRNRQAVSCIGQIKDEKAVSGLIKLLKDDDADVRLGAVRALASMKVRDAEPEFERLLQDSNETVRMLTLRTLASADKGKYLPKVIATVQEKMGYEKSHAIQLLGDLGAREYVGELEELLKDADEFNRHYAAHALWKITGKVYPYEKGKDALHSEQFWKKRLEDARRPGRDHESPQNAIQEAQKNGFLLDEKTK